MALSITKATVGGSEDTWGTTTNTALDDIVSEVNNNADGTNATTPNMTSLQIGGVAMTSTADELNILDGATITTNEINILDGDTSATSTTVVDADRVVFNDDGTMKQVAMLDIATYINAQASSGPTYTAGTGISISGSNVISSTVDSPSEVGLGNLSSSGNALAGNFTATGNITAYSDERLKSNIRTVDNALNMVCDMRGVFYDKDNEAGVGVIAQEMKDVLPEVVMDGEYLSVSYGNVVGVLIEAIKELKYEVEELRNASTK